MSLNQREREVTAQDLRRHAEVAGLSAGDLGAWLRQGGADVEDASVERVLETGGTDPVLVWAVRDVLDAAVRAQGQDAGGWRVLTDAARHRAQQWFGLREVPPRPAR